MVHGLGNVLFAEAPLLINLPKGVFGGHKAFFSRFLDHSGSFLNFCVVFGDIQLNKPYSAHCRREALSGGKGIPFDGACHIRFVPASVGITLPKGILCLGTALVSGQAVKFHCLCQIIHCAAAAQHLAEKILCLRVALRGGFAIKAVCLLSVFFEKLSIIVHGSKQHFRF